MVDQKQASIRRELDSLSTANVAATRSYDVNGGLSVTRDQNRAGDAEPGSAGFNGFIDYGSPIQAVGGTVSLSGNEHAQLWRDNRLLDQNSKPASLAGEINAGRDFAVGGKDQLALNDSVTVTLSGAEPGSISGSGFGGSAVTNRSLSTARASAGPLGFAQGNGTAELARARAASPAMPALRASPPTGGVTTVNAGTLQIPAPPPLPANTPPPARESPAETLRSVGRISLAVNFPREGQVYHFKKLRADARLTLWSVRPARFERLASLAGLAGLLAAGWAVKGMVGKRLARRRLGALLD